MKLKILILSLLLVVCLGAEAQTAKAGPQLHEVKEAVMHLDSVVTALHGWKAGRLPQGSLEESRKIWQTFRESVYEGEYKHALDLYFGENADGEKNAGNFLLVLMYSSQRYRFFSDVLRPLLGEFMGKDAALEMYVDILRLEKEMEDLAACLAAIERERSAIQAY
ncbi:MAG: hypothetical protein IJ721_02645 [Bacteroidales bacterium]|nr:hypothetical protein [Bacteroidales bacterium]